MMMTRVLIQLIYAYDLYDIIIIFRPIGSAYIYVTSDGGSTWSQSSKIVASDGAVHDQFGVSVSIYGNIAVIGSPFDIDSGMVSGKSSLFFDSIYLCYSIYCVI